MSRSIDQIQNILFTFIGIFHLYSMALDGNASLLFQIHIIQHLTVSYLYRISEFQQTIRQR